MIEGTYLVNIEYLKELPMPAVLHSHPNYELFYFHEGGGNYLIGDHIYSLSPGDLILMHGMTLHCPNMDEKNKYVRTVVSFDPAYVRAISGKLFTIDPLEPFERHKNIRLQLHGEDQQRVESRLAEMNDCFHHKDPIAHNRFRLVFLEMLLDLYGLCAKPSMRKSEALTPKEQTVQKVVTWVEGHFAEQVSFDDIAAHMDLNKHYLSRVFRELTGLTVFDYLYQRRINEAKIIFLLQDQVSVTEVCYRVGFNNLSHFSRMFKQRVGCTPDEYKRRRLINPLEH
ncbi:helix-turn-helix domain-containing protein [Paenibacillus eucommiae]|uniref:AraC-like DNA-binding protein n=1 Tax=Paenibacillus eucommiae TaxID=1355755 RepID=A0ABS4ITG2_9BACL|nr:AraC family transcriptional regulator [Paenibacillus eucommiae]MBP1990843.1 AraC-like DNA-binding protein [Paenibacillus eucommiae]